jgi:hypothetical protein
MKKGNYLQGNYIYYINIYNIFRPIDKNIWLRCKIERSKKIKKGFILSLSDNENSLISGLKKSKNLCSNYMIRMDCDLETEKKDSNFIGKLKSNFFGTEYNLYDSGVNPKMLKNKNKNDDINVNIRKELGYISYVRKYINI